MAVASSISGGKHMTNYARLGHAAQELLPEMLRELISTKEPPCNLISDCRQNITLYRLLRPVELHRINNVNIDGYANFDIQLLYKLIRNLNLVPNPTAGWDTRDPMLHELTIGDDVERIRRNRNEIIHRGNANVSDTELSEYFSIFKDIASRFESYLGKQNGVFVSKFKQLETCSMDSEAEENFIQTLDRLAEEEREVKCEIEKVRSDVEQLKEKDGTVSRLEEENRLLRDRMTKMEQMFLLFKTNIADPIPQNIRDLFHAYISDWSGEESTYISTRATQYVINTLSSGTCVTVTGCPGSGKSAIIHHVALHYQREMDYEIIPVVNSPFDLKHYNNPLKNQVFILDNVFGTITVNCQVVDTWLSNTDMIEKILSMGNVKLLIACRLHIVNDPLFKRLKVLIPNQCNLHTDEFCLLENERVQIAQKYLDEHEIACILDILNVYAFFPLLCKLYSKDKYSSIRSFFENPVEAFKQNIEAMRQDSNKVQYCAFTMCVLFKDLLREDWFERNDENATNMVSVCEEFGLDYRLERKNLKQQLDAFENTYVKKLENRYCVIHDKLYDVAAVECGQDMLGCFIDYADVTFIGDRYLIEGVDTDSDDTVIKITAKHERQYFQRLLCDLKQGNIYSTFQNRQLQHALYREKLLSFLTDTANSSLVQSCLRKFDEIHLDNINLHEEEMIDYSFSQSDDEDSDHLSDVSGDSNSEKDVQTLLSFSCKSSVQNNFKVDIPLPLLESSSLGHDDIVNMLIEMGCKVNIRDNYCRSALFNASLNGHYRVVQTLLRNRADALQCDKWERSPLYVACEKGHVETVKLLLEESDITKCDSCFFKSPLHVACEKGNTKIVQMLLEYGSHISDINSDGHSPLYIACEFGHLVLVHLLLDYHADINQSDEKNSSPLLIACMNGHFEIVKLLIENRADIAVCNSDGLSPLHVASKWGKTEVVKVLLQTNSNVNLKDRLYGRTPLFLACEGRHEDIIQLLVRKGCNIFTCDARKQSPLYVACKTGQTNTVKIFLDHMTDNNVLSFNYSDWSPLIAACEGGNTSIVKMLVERNIYLNVRDDNNKCPLHICCEKGFTDIVRLLLYHECEINCLDGDHQTALFIASENGFSEIVSLLLDNNADPNITDEEDWSPFHVACHEGHTGVVKVLLQYNAETMKCNNDRLPSPLVVASRNGHADVVQLLLTNNADPNQSDTRKWSPLHFACKAGYTDVVRLLLQYGANPTLRNNGGRCPVDLARSSFHNDVVQIVEEYLTNMHFPSVDQKQA